MVANIDQKCHPLQATLHTSQVLSTFTVYLYSSFTQNNPGSFLFNTFKMTQKGDPPPMLNVMQPWIQQNYYRLGLSPSGLFVGSKLFKNRLFEEPIKPRGADKAVIRRAVNYMLG